VATPGNVEFRAEAGRTVGEFGVQRPGSVLQSREVNIVHEIGGRLEDATTQRTLFIEPSNHPTWVLIKSEVVGGGARAIGSPAYMATVRRRETRVLAGQIGALEQHAEREDFSTCTFPVLERLNALLKTLAQADEEGNTREIVREIRSSIMNRGWERYRSPDVRSLVKAILEHLADVEEVSAKDAHGVFRRLSDLLLDPIGAPVFDVLGEENEDEGETADGQEG
jgi:hypothetical protein